MLAMAKMGIGKEGTQFEDDLRALLEEKKRARAQRSTRRASLARNRASWVLSHRVRALLTEMFDIMDEDDLGFIDLKEYKHSFDKETLE